jgi:hypothetical protein
MMSYTSPRWCLSWDPHQERLQSQARFSSLPHLSRGHLGSTGAILGRHAGSNSTFVTFSTKDHALKTALLQKITSTEIPLIIISWRNSTFVYDRNVRLVDIMANGYQVKLHSCRKHKIEVCH